VVHTPAPAFVDGIRTALLHNRHGHLGFLLGQVRMNGWWYYFPVALFVKTPIAYLISVAVGILVCVRKWGNVEFALPVAFGLGVLLPALRGHIDIGVRHVEPLYVGLSIVSALGFKQLLDWGTTDVKALLGAGALFCWMLIASVSCHPDYISYFNEFAWSGPDKILVDSNYDWGQDYRLLARRLHELGINRFFYARQLGPIDYEYLEKWYGLPHMARANDFTPDPGWTVVSPTYDKVLSHSPSDTDWRLLSPEIPDVNDPNAMRHWYELCGSTTRRIIDRDGP
jgi:hypothetical protein